MTAPERDLPALRWGVEVVEGEVPDSLENPAVDRGYLQIGADAVLVSIPSTGRMLVTRDRVVLAPAEGCTVQDMGYLVYGWATRFVLVLREEFCLHASAVQVPGGAIGVMGDVGAGKSTTVAGLAARGRTIVVDDVLPVRMDDAGAWVHGWSRPVHLLPDAAERLGLPEDLPRLPRADRKIVLATEGVGEDLRLRLLIDLRRDAALAAPVAEPLLGLERVTALRANIDGTGMTSTGGRAGAFFRWVTDLANAVPVVRVRRPDDGDWHLDAVLDLVEAALVDVP